jgi:collagenase-like PrtC family protease
MDQQSKEERSLEQLTNELKKGPEHWNIGGAAGGFQHVVAAKAALDDLGVEGVSFTVFDMHSGMKWAGGRPHAFAPGQTKESFAQLVGEYNRRGIQFNLVFSNLFVEEQHLGDKRCNWLLEHCYRPGNGVIVGSHVLARYIRENYPDYRLVHSLTHFNKDPAYYYEHSDLYDVFVLPPHLNYRKPVLQEMLANLGPEKIEILVNETCFRECNIRQDHYDLISKACLEDDWDLWEQLTNGFCQRAHAERFTRLGEAKDVKRIKNFTLSQDEVEELKALGIQNFKLANRQVPSQQYAKWMDYYLFDRLGLSTTMYVYENYYKPAMHFAGRG